MNYELGIIGAGNMAEAIVRGVIGGGILQPSQMVAADPSPQRQDIFRNGMGIRTTDDNQEIASRSSMILLSVKPQMMVAVLKELSSTLQPDTLIVSIAAGVSTRLIEQTLGGGKSWRVVRAMPNTPMLVGAGAVALAGGAAATDDDIQRASALFESAAKVIVLTEQLIDAVTAVSGSGPAYFFFLVEQMVAAGVAMGLSAADARLLAAQTAYGSAKMVLESPDSPAELRRKVTSPNGTTHAAITHMENSNWPAITRDALEAARKRSAELGQ